MIHLLFSPFYEASITMTPDGGLLVASSRERLLAWGIVFCLLAAAALALWVFRIARPWMAAAFLATLLIPVVVMPSLRHEHIHVLPDRITVSSGVWIAPSRDIIDLSGLLHIRERDTQFHLAGYTVEPNAIWHLARRDGSRDTFLLNDFFTAHRMVVAQYLRDRGRIVERH
jgi:hypothetical protein